MAAKGFGLVAPLRAGVMALAAMSFTALSTPADASGRGHHGGGYYYGHGGYGHGYSSGGYYGRGYYGRGYGGGSYYGGSYYGSGHGGGGHHRGHGGLSGGEAALIAVGVIGGAILIDRALDDRRYEDRRYEGRRYEGRRYDDRRAGSSDDDYYYQRDARPYDDDARLARGAERAREDDFAIDEPALLGARAARGSLESVAVNAAFRECVAETRGAAGAGGMNVAMPGAPTGVERLADGSVRMTAQFRASNPRGESWTRQFVCEADDQGVRFLQID